MFQNSLGNGLDAKIDVHGQVMKNSDFQPYDDNGGDIVAIAGDGYVIIASDTRLTSGYSILTRNQSKLFKLNDRVILGASGCWADSTQFTHILELRTKMYKYDHNKEISGESAGAMVSNMLYNRRFFPYYSNIIIAFLDKNDRGVCYHYDPVGNYEPLTCTASGPSSALIQPILDNLIEKENIDNLTADEKKVSLDEAIKIMRDCFISASEIQIQCGDGVHVMIVTKDGIKEERWPLRTD